MSDLIMPHGWAITTLGEVTDIVSGIGFPKHLQGNTEGVLPVFKVGDISSAWKEGQFLLSKSPNYLSLQEAKLLRGKAFPKGTVVFAKIGEALRLNRRAMLAQDSLVDNNVMGLIPNHQAIVAKYLFQFMVTIDLGELSRATAVPSVRKSDVQDIQLPLPPINEQTRIVAEIEKQFSRLDEAVANLKRVKVNLKRYKAAVLKAAVEGKLTEEWRKLHPDVEPADKLLERILAERRKGAGKGKYKEPTAPETANLPELPAGWVWACVEQLSVLVQYGSSAKTSEDASGIPVLRMGNIVDGVLDWEVLKYLPADHDEFPALFLKAGDLLFNRTNSPELVGKTAVYTGIKDPCSFASYLIRVRSSAYYLSPLLAHYINSSYGRQWVKSVVTQQVGQANVNGTKLQALAVPVPPLDEQHQIVAEVERRLSIVAGAEAQLDANLRRADRLRQSILKQAFSGQLVPQDPSDEPASVLLERIRANAKVGATHASPRTKTEQPRRARHASPLRETKPAPAAPANFASLDSVLAAIIGLMQPGQEYSRADLADALGLPTGRWNAAIQELKRRGKVRQVGERRGAKYMRGIER